MVKSKMIFSVWPNPAQQFVCIQNNNKVNQMSRLTVLNQSGVKLIEIMLSWGENKINIQHLKAGLYFLQLQTASINNEVLEFIKE